MRRLSPLAVGCLLALAGCGGSPEVSPELLVLQLGHPDAGKAEEAVKALARQGAEDPARIVPLLIDRLVEMHERHAALAARLTPDLSSLPEGEPRNEALVALTRAMHRRLDQAGFSVGQVRQEGSSVEAYVLPPADRTFTARAQELLEAELRRPGRFELRAEVPPPFATTPERPLSPWDGDGASYAAWLTGEKTRFEAARSGGAAYVPSRADIALVPVLPGPETGAADSVALRVSAPGTGVTEEDVVASLRDDAVHGTPALYLVPAPGREARVREHLAANAGLTLWLVGDGEALLPVRLPGKPGLAVSFPVAGERLEEARTRAAAFAGRMSAGRHPFPVTVEPLARPTVIDAQHPLCRALVRIGPAAEPALDRLAAKDEAFVPLVKQLKEGILQMRTGQR